MYKVTIITPIYNVSKYIERCACSLFNQSFSNIEYIFVDDCTPDNSIDILQNVIDRYPERKKDIHIINHNRNRGLSAARTTGLSMATGEYIWHIDSDDFIQLNAVELLYNKAKKENADIVVCDFCQYWEDNIKIYTKSNINTSYINFTKQLLDTSVIPASWNKLIKTSLYKENNIKYVEGINMAEDYAVTPRLAYYARKIAKVDAPLYYYIQTNSSSYTKNFSDDAIKSIIFAMTVLSDFFTHLPDSSDYSSSLMQGKLSKKLYILKNAYPKYIKKYLSIFPEANDYLPIAQLRIDQKIILFLAKNNQYVLLRTFLFLFKIVKSPIEFFRKHL